MSPGANTLSRAASPYLRQHADNPVHWREWTPEALAEAADRDVPILLSIGYAACHWCHVMAHESFDDAEVAAAANSGFVCIKVDREERPDLDAVYMNATVALTGQGGWPMTCFLTPDGRPFFCGTYYPKPTFLQLLAAVTDTWRNRRGEVEEASDKITEELRSMASGLPGGGPPLQPALCDHAVAAVLQDEDVTRGGFAANPAGAPKFPPSALLEGLLRNHERTGDIMPMESVERTCTAMARGGIYDQLAGGFARYSVDAAWVVPHFEKMLYDNALLLRAYAHWARRTATPLAHKVAAETAAFMIDELGADGMFTSSLDADADGVEGLTYVFTPGQLREFLGEDDGRWAAELFAVTEGGTFEQGASVLQLPRDPDDPERFARVRAALLAARLTRPQPGRDDKVVTAWNGLAITALAEAAVALDRPELLDAATQCARAIWELHMVDGRLRRASLGGSVGGSAAILEDHGALATGLLTVHQMTGETVWLEAALMLLDIALEHFADPDRPGRWFDTADDAETLMVRPADPLDGATPSGASLIAEALLTAAHLAPAERADRYAAAADATLAAATPILARLTRSGGHWLAVAEAAVGGPIQIAVACDPARSELLAVARRLAPGGAVVVGGAVNSSELLIDRDRVGGADAAYVCRGRTCDLPVTTAPELAAALGSSV
ncbi:thioredoxin domain-containing protein [Mycolicibacterium novocastrense]|uniref:Thioredoxin domain-containing protein n=1 Tax=Mycolicibacterium novocastrense TaxID=59813 RepID=A0AAW5SER4_MYCNV|nr:thioredoxin domain-containing protein [Mycolicibacterium novocastrense]MCV7022556.1 thioredoxin domain-containing protein [Mycolicibacterium novocastrense]GAT08222.1 thioredoxin domain-containing protein [Mycolicibacterium novocastrense]